MRKFSLKIDTNGSAPTVEGGFESRVEWEGSSRLILQSRFEVGDRTFYLAGRIYSFKNETELSEWLGRFGQVQVERWVRKVDGDLVIVAVDRKAGKTYLITDRNGAARAYYANQAGSLCITNSYPDLARLMRSPRLSSFAIYQLLTLNWVVDPYALIDGAGTTQPGQIIVFEPERTTVSQYYSPVQLNVDYFRSEIECVNALDLAFREVFQKRYTPARAPYVLLSGGIDSVTMLKYVSQAAGGPVHTLTFNVLGVPSNDVEAARIVARHCGSIHHEVVLDPKNAARLWVECLSGEADTSNSSAILSLYARKYLQGLGGKFDVYCGVDTRLHTPSFDYPKELGIRINRGKWRRSRALPLALSVGSKFQRLWPFAGKNYLRYWLDHLKPADNLSEFVLEGLMGSHLPNGFASKENGYHDRLLRELPPLMPDDRMQEIYKKYVSFMYRTQYSDDMNCVVSSGTGSSMELHVPFYDWQDVDVSNRVPYHLGMRPTFTVRSWDKIPLVRKRILRTLLKGFVPKEVLFRAKATVSTQYALFNSPLRNLTRSMLEKWGNDLIDSVDPVVGDIIRTYSRSFAARDMFVAADDRLLWSTMQIAYLAVLNQACHDRSFEAARELESLYERAMNGA
jgi:asparagine synthetase B (glutamine-hydrolysing)